VMSMLLTRDALQLVADAKEEREPEQLAQRFLGEADLVLAEAFLMRRERRSKCCAVPATSRRAVPSRTGLVAIVTDMDEVYPQLPHFALDDVNGIVDFILQQAQQPSVQPSTGSGRAEG